MAGFGQGVRDRSRNFLFDHLSLGEDEMGLTLRPDCAKLPYLLRAYFAFKMGLPFGYSKCTRGDRGKPPKCDAWFNIQHPEVTRPSPPAQIIASAAPTSTPTPNLLQQMFSPVAARVRPRRRSNLPAKRAGARGLLRRIFADRFRRRSFRVRRTLASDDSTDHLSRAADAGNVARRGRLCRSVRAILMIVRRRAANGRCGGRIFAVDAEPDGTVARKRFWRGNFLFARTPRSGVPASSASGRSRARRAAGCGG